MSRIWLLVGAGGFIGSIARYFSQVYVSRMIPSTFPFGTLGVNIAGCLLIGIIYSLGEKEQVLSQEMRFFLATGFCGGFTTFSAFSFESMNLMHDGDYLKLVAYVSFSVVVGIAATFGGMMLGKLI